MNGRYIESPTVANRTGRLTFVVSHEPKKKRRIRADQARSILKRLKVYNFIIAFKIENDGCSPSMREIVEACNIGSTSVVAFYIQALVKEGKITTKFGSRGIMVVGGIWKFIGEASENANPA